MESYSLGEALAQILRRRQRMGQRRLAPGPRSTRAAGPPGRAPVKPGHPSVPVDPPDPGPQIAHSPKTPAEAALACLNLEQLHRATRSCTACELCQSRSQVVFADGGARPGGIFFVGEAPGAEEDRQGIPFVGPSGQLLTDIIEKGMGMARNQVTIANVLKCRPPGNRDPKPAEKALCTPFLDRQIELVDPAVLIPLGTHAAQHLLQTDAKISSLRGRVHDRGGRKVVPTFHPAFLLRNPGRKRDCWQDIQLAMKTAGLPLPGRA